MSSRPRLDRLSAEDERILALERGSVAGHVCKVVIVDPQPDGAPISLGGLRASIANRLVAAPRCMQRIRVLPPGLGRPVWVGDEDFDITRHVRSPADADRPLDIAALRRLVARLMTERLDRRHPLWTMDIAPMNDLRTAIIWRVHHCMADGMTALRIGDAMLWQGERQPSAPDPPAAASAPVTEAPSELVLAAAADRLRAALQAARALRHSHPSSASWRGAVHDMGVLAGTVRRELVPSEAVVPLDADIGSHRSVAWTRSSLEALHHAAKSIEPTVTLNDAVIGIVAAGVRHWLVSVNRAVGALRVRIPVSLHRLDEDPLGAGNRDSFIDVDVPMDDMAVAERIRAISRQTAERKQRHDAEHLDRLFREVGMLPFGSHALAMTAGPHEFSLCVSNVPGPNRSLYVAGGELAELHSIVEIAPRHALRVSVISASGGISFGLCADGDILDANFVAVGIDSAIAELLQCQPAKTRPQGAVP